MDNYSTPSKEPAYKQGVSGKEVCFLGLGVLMLFLHGRFDLFWPFLAIFGHFRGTPFLAIFGILGYSETVRHLPGRVIPCCGGVPPSLGGVPPPFDQMGTCRDVVNPVLVITGC